MKATKQIFTTLLTLGTLSLLTACGSSRQLAGSSDYSSSSTSLISTGNTTLAYCNQGSGDSFTGKLKAYTDSSNNVRMDYVYLRLTAVPTTFKDESSYITLWKWLANPSGYTNLDSTPLSFALVNASNGQYITNWKTSLKWSEVKTTASSLGYSDPQTFLNNVTLLVDLKDPNGDYDVLKISNYDINTNKAINAMDALLPLFAANPADYALDNGSARASVLQGLHPFKNQAGQFTTSQYQSMSNNFCF